MTLRGNDALGTQCRALIFFFSNLCGSYNGVLTKIVCVSHNFFKLFFKVQESRKGASQPKKFNTTSEVQVILRSSSHLSQRNVRHVAKNVRHGAKNVQQGAKNVRDGVKNLQDVAKNVRMVLKMFGMVWHDAKE